MRAVGRSLVLLPLLAMTLTSCTLPSHFQAMRSEIAALAVEPDPPTVDGLRRYRGVIHVHSHLSHDSRGDDDEILRAAVAAGADFLMMTDHNGPEIFRRGLNGLHGGILVLRGAEIRAEEDYVLALGIDSFIDPDGMTFREVTAAVAAQGGVAIGAHPARFRHWDDPNLAGVEVWDLYDEATTDRWRYAGRAFDILLSYGDYPAEILLGIVRHPAAALARFDDETRRRRLVAVGTPDAHQNIRVLGRQLDRYPLAFRLVTTYLFAEDRTKTALLDALRRGRTYFAFDALTPAATFDFRIVDARGATWLMGDEPAAARDQTLHVFAPHRGRITVVRDGRVIGQADAARLALPVDGPGVYRAEVALQVQGRWRPWIYSNPIYVR
jgi:hypothetical protein